MIRNWEITIRDLAEENLAFPSGSVVKNPPANGGDIGSIPGLGRSPGEGNGNPHQYPCLGNPMDREAWWATVHGVARVGPNLQTKPLSLPLHLFESYLFCLFLCLDSLRFSVCHSFSACLLHLAKRVPGWEHLSLCVLVPCSGWEDKWFCLLSWLCLWMGELRNSYSSLCY